MSTLTISPEAVNVLHKWIRICNELPSADFTAEGNEYGSRSHELEAWQTLARSLVGLVALGGTVISTDDSMVEGYNEQIAYGLVKHSRGDGRVTWGIHT